MRNLTLLSVLALLTGCMGHIRYLGPDVAPQPVAQRPVAYITNPELRQEWAVLEASSLYTISPDPAAPSKITLAPIRKYPGCGNPMLGAIFTLGLLPAYMPDSYVFRYTEDGPGGKQAFEHNVRVEYRYSLWEAFFFWADDDKELGRAVRAAALPREPAKAAWAERVPEGVEAK